MNWIVFFTFALLLMAPKSWAETIATAGVSNESKSGYQRDCEARYLEKKCDRFFTDYPDLLKYQVDCRQPIDASAELGRCWSGIEGGAKDTWKLIQKIGSFMWNGPVPPESRQLRERFLETCAKVQDCKINLIRSLNPDLITPEFSERLQFIDTGSRLEVIVAAQEKIRNLQKLENIRNILRDTPSGPELDAKMDEAVPGWSQRQLATNQSLWQLGLAGADHIAKVDACFSREVQAEAVCHGSTLR